MSKDKSGVEALLDFAAEHISKELKRMNIVNKTPDKIAIALLLLSEDGEAIEMLRAVDSADNIEGSQIKGVREELSRLSKRTQMLLRSIEVSTQQK